MDGSSILFRITSVARLAQSVEHETLNLRVVGSSPTLGAWKFFFFFFLLYTGWSPHGITLRGELYVCGAMA